MDCIDRTQEEQAPQQAPDRPLPTRFGREKRAPEPLGRHHAPGSRSDADETATADDEVIFEDHGGL